MSQEGKFSIARMLTLLFDEESRPPWLLAVWIPFMLGGFFWLMTKVGQPPTKEADRRQAVQLNAQAIVSDKFLNVRHEPVLIIKQGTLLAQEIEWGRTFFSADAPKESSIISSREDYVALERQSLVAYAQIGDSLLKHSGDSTATLKRGKQLRVFYFHSLWP